MSLNVHILLRSWNFSRRCEVSPNANCVSTLLHRASLSGIWQHRPETICDYPACASNRDLPRWAHLGPKLGQSWGGFSDKVDWTSTPKIGPTSTAHWIPMFDHIGYQCFVILVKSSAKCWKYRLFVQWDFFSKVLTNLGPTWAHLSKNDQVGPNLVKMTKLGQRKFQLRMT